MKLQKGVWLGFKLCGCLVAVCREDDERYRHQNDQQIVEWLRDGLIVRFATREEWDGTYKALFLEDCPHEAITTPVSV